MSTYPELRLEYKANVNQANHDGNTPLIEASRDGDGNKGIVSLLIEAKANVNQPNNKGITPLMIAEHNENQELIMLLNQKMPLPVVSDNEITRGILNETIEEPRTRNSTLALALTTVASPVLEAVSNITQGAVNMIAGHTTTMGNSSNSTVLQVASPNQIVQNTSSFESSAWWDIGIIGGGAVVATGLVTTGMMVARRAWNQYRNYRDIVE